MRTLESIMALLFAIAGVIGIATGRITEGLLCFIIVTIANKETGGKE